MLCRQIGYKAAMERLLLGISAMEPIEPAEYQGESSRTIEEGEDSNKRNIQLSCPGNEKGESCSTSERQYKPMARMERKNEIEHERKKI